MKLLAFLESFSPKQIALTGALLVILIGIGDLFAGPQISTSIFYILPICICAWHGSRRMGIAFAFLAAIVWLSTEVVAGQTYTNIFILYWNWFTRLATFLIIAYVLSGYRSQLTVEEALADTDSLTGANNSRAFYEKVEAEINRFRRFRRPFSIAYIDLDNFKYVNDNMGHQTGDHLLQKIIEVMQQTTRVTDVVARIGGDEFAVLFGETDQKSAKEAVGKLQLVLLDAMREKNWPITFSIGVVTCEEIPESVEQIISFADGLMYSVKKSGKNRIAYANFQKNESFG